MPEAMPEGPLVQHLAPHPLALAVALDVEDANFGEAGRCKPVGDAHVQLTEKGRFGAPPRGLGSCRRR